MAVVHVPGDNIVIEDATAQEVPEPKEKKCVQCGSLEGTYRKGIIKRNAEFEGTEWYRDMPKDEVTEVTTWFNWSPTLKREDTQGPFCSNECMNLHQRENRDMIELEIGIRTINKTLGLSEDEQDEAWDIMMKELADDQPKYIEGEAGMHAPECKCIDCLRIKAEVMIEEARLNAQEGENDQDDTQATSEVSEDREIEPTDE